MVLNESQIIVAVVGLLQGVSSHSQDGNKTKSSMVDSLSVISPSTAFDDNMGETSSGVLRDLG